VGLIARCAEAAGIATLCMSSAVDITASVNPPRAVFLDYPLGHTAGPPERPDIQRQILKQALEALIHIKTPGTVETLPYIWPDNPDWENDFDMMNDDRTDRVDTPQYQTEEDRLMAENHDFSALASCGCEGCRG
jgi:hypothetical protein